MKQDVPFNESLLHTALAKRGFSLRRVPGTPVWKVRKKSVRTLLLDIASPATSFAAGWVASDKVLTKILLKRAGIPVAEGRYFRGDTVDEAAAYAESIGYPVVIKPAVGQHGDCVFSQIGTEPELRDAVRFVQRRIGMSAYFITEKHINGREYRLFAALDGSVACAHRSAPVVIGDGSRTIMKLIAEENYRRLHPRDTCLCDIKFDDVLFTYLEKQNLTIDSVPAKGKKITLRDSTNVSMGGWCREITPLIHKDFAALAARVLRAVPGLSVVGIDVICRDITKPMGKQKYVICELNASPGLSLHVVPPEGKPVQVTSYLVKQFQNI